MFGCIDAVLRADNIQPAVGQGCLQVRLVGGEGGRADEGGGVLPALVLVVGAVQEEGGAPHLAYHLQALVHQKHISRSIKLSYQSVNKNNFGCGTCGLKKILAAQGLHSADFLKYSFLVATLQ
jgi:hypothetical protein